MCFRRNLLLWGSWCTLAAPAAAGVVYNSQIPTGAVNGITLISDTNETDSRIEDPFGLEFDSQAGDSITLASTERFVTGFSVRLAAFHPTGVVARTAPRARITAAMPTNPQLSTRRPISCNIGRWRTSHGSSRQPKSTAEIAHSMSH